jgi:hypothetical protein
VRESRAEAARSGFDAAGLTVVAGVAARVYAIVNADEAGSGSPATLGTRGTAAGVLTESVVIERRAAVPLVDLRLLTSAHGSPERISCR